MKRLKEWVIILIVNIIYRDRSKVLSLNLYPFSTDIIYLTKKPYKWSGGYKNSSAAIYDATGSVILYRKDFNVFARIFRNRLKDCYSCEHNNEKCNTRTKGREIYIDCHNRCKK